MIEKEKTTYKPKAKNVKKLEAFLNKIEKDNGKQHKLGRDLLQ
jgi:hypothetical protein